MSELKVGQKIICVNEDGQLKHMFFRAKKDKIYSSDGYVSYPGELPGLFIKECMEINQYSGLRFAFITTRFVPADESFTEETISRLIKENKQDESLRQLLFENTNPVDNPPRL